jgi:hypothetical protein
MKKLILSIIVTLFMGSAFATVRGIDPIVDSKNATKKLSELLHSSQIGVELNEEILVNVKIMLNNDNEIIVLNVDTNNSVIENFVKTKLNYQKLTSNVLKTEVQYNFDVRFKANKY